MPPKPTIHRPRPTTPSATGPEGAPEPMTDSRSIRIATASMLFTLAAILALLTTAAPASAGGVSLLEELQGDHACLHCRLDWLERNTVAAAAESGAALRFDERTGADRANYAPHRHVDFKHMLLEIDIEDMNTPRFEAQQTLTIEPISRPLSVLRLDARQLNIQGVMAIERGRAATFSHDGDVLTLRFDPPIEPGREHQVRIDYVCENPVDGLFWLTETPEWPDRPAQIHTQGQPETNSFWFPAHDSPNVRLTTEMVVTVPAGYEVSSNGELIDRTFRGPDGDRETFHWRLDQRHVNYLVTLVIGKFDIVDVGRGEMDMPVYVPPGLGYRVEQTYGRTLDMMRLFEDRFGYEYPFGNRYAQLVVWNFGAGGMENTTASTMYDTAIFDEKSLQDGDLDGLISHELAHMWFGDLITCNTWAHIWLNEGFATFSTALWYEERDGYDEGYLPSIYASARGVAGRDRLRANDAEAGLRPGMVSRLYEHPWDVFRRGANPYPKGSTVLHMLRQKLGEDVFWEGVRTYTRRFADSTVETDDLRGVLEEVSGLSLEHFFDQWVHRPGAPEVTVDIKWNEADKELKLTVEQTQRIDAHVPAFAFKLPVAIHTDSAVTPMTIDVTGRRHERTISLDAEPTMVVVDPALTVYMAPTIRQPVHRFIEQLRSGPTHVARMDAAEALKGHAGSRTTEALAAVVRDSSAQHSFRAAAAGVLGEHGATATLIEIARAGVDDARARRGVIDALAVAGRTNNRDGALEVLAAHAADEDESYATRSTALRGLGRLGDRSHLDIIIDALDSESQHDQVRSAALSALADLDQPEGLEAAIPFTRLGHLSRLRPTAINTVARLAEHDREAAYEAVAPLIRDQEARTRSAAGAALVRIEDERAVEDLRRHAVTWPHPVERERAGRWADQLGAALRRDAPAGQMREEIERLRRELEELKEAVAEEK
ncbi:MAG: hypothetical protein EA376_14585 [Phycisphaeraceae bacterium]|nr:MAG: hypothetical protein EA376_14585 [Phycisphaeraceae bacterium]